MTIGDVSKLHDASSEVANRGVDCLVVEFPQLATFHRSLCTFKEKVSIHKLDSYCEQLIKQCEIFHARLARSPFSPVFCESCQPELRSEINALVSRSLNFDPSARAAFDALRDSFLSLAAIADNPAARFVSNLIRDLSTEDICIVVRRLSLSDDRKRESPDLISHVRGLLGITEDAQRIRIVTAAQIREGAPIDRLIIFGPFWALKWNRTEFLVRSPIAPRVQAVVCGHEAPGTEAISLIVKSSLIQVNGARTVSVFTDSTSTLTEDDWNARLDSSQASADDHEESLRDDQQVPAIPVKYADSKGEYLEADRRVIVLRIHAGKCKDAEKIFPGDLIAGDYVLRATGGSDSDVTSEFADQLLGNRATELRNAQASWKRALRQKIIQTGMGNTVGLLRQAGCRSLSAANLRNWQSSRNIAPEDLEHSLAPVLRVLGMERQFPAISHATKRLRKAHHVAGNMLHRLVLKRLRSEDLTELLIRGVLEVRDNERGPCKTAFRVEAVGNERPVDRHRLGIIFDIGTGPQQNDE